jgi:ribonuclease HI
MYHPLHKSMLFLRLGGARAYPPPVLCIVQTDGSFQHWSGSAAIAARMTMTDEVLVEQVHPIYNVESSTEAKWASVYFGLQVATQSKEYSVGVENDSLSVIHHLLFGFKDKPRDYAYYYNYKIHETVKDMDWCGIRWIPRERNQADSLVKRLA